MSWLPPLESWHRVCQIGLAESGAVYRLWEKVGQGPKSPSPSAVEAMSAFISKESPFSLPDCSSSVSCFWLFSGPTRTEAAFILPQHTTETEKLKPQLKLLLSHFNIPYDVEELRDAAKEIELFSLVLDGFFVNANTGVHKENTSICHKVVCLYCHSCF